MKILLRLFIFSIISIHYLFADDWISQSIDHSINSRFVEAESLLCNRIASGDSTIETYFYLASVLNSKMTHFENSMDESEFIRVLKKIIGITASRLENETDLNSEELARLYFFRGSAYGYLAYYQGQTGEWYSALSNGLEAVSLLKEAVQLDSVLYDAYLGVGTYYYWKSTKLKLILWLPFVADSREEGIALIKKTIRNNARSKYMAMHQLVYILLDYGSYDEALQYAKKIIEAYPQSQFMWWANAHTYYKRREFTKAVLSYKMLLDLIEHDPRANPMHWLLIQIRLAEIYQEMGDYKTSAEYCNLALTGKYSDQDLTLTGRERLVRAGELMQENRLKLKELSANR